MLNISNIITCSSEIFKLSQMLVFLPNNDHSHANLIEVKIFTHLPEATKVA